MATVIILLTIFVLSVLVGVFATVLLTRNDKVYDYRINLLGRIREAIMKDLHEGVDDWKWRYDETESVDYRTMVYKFWKPLDSFYPRDPARREK